MHRTSAAIGSVLFFLLAPGTVAGLVPWWLSGWRVEESWPPLRLLGAALALAGALVLAGAFRRFVVEGAGTPAPVAPTERLVVGGAYRYVRNPMYLAVLATVAGQGLLLGQVRLLLYAGALWLAFAAFVLGYEEPVLRSRYGAQYETYRRAVPAWWPRLRPWNPGPGDGG